MAAAAHMAETGRPVSLMLGHSLGGAAVLAAAGDVDTCKGVVTIGAPADPGHVAHLFGKHIDEIEAQGAAEVRIAGRPFRVRKAFLDDIADQPQSERIRNLRRPLLVCHSPVDDIVGIDNAGEIFRHARHPKSFVSLDDADHLLTRRSDAGYVADIVAAWARRFLDLDAGSGDGEAVEGAVVVEETLDGRFQQVVRVGRHAILADEPVSYGGDDSGLSPYDLLMASLGACTSMTIRMYAERKSIPLDRVRIVLRHQKIHAADCADCETKGGRIDRVDRVVELTGALDPAHRQKLLEIADKCPVHRTLHSEVSVTTSLADPNGIDQTAD